MPLLDGKQLKAASVTLDKIIEALIQADGGQAFTADQPMGGFKLTGLGAGTDPGDAATKSQVDAVAAGLSWKDACLLATAAALPANAYANGTLGVGATITADAVGVLTIDGTATVLGDRVLVQDDGLKNGIYEVTTEGTVGVAFILTRVTDCDTSAELDSAAVFVQAGTANKDIGFTQTVDAPTVGTTALVWTPFTGTAALTYAAAGTIEPDDGSAEGSASTLSRSDHQHAIATAAPGAVAIGDGAAEGAGTDFARATHTHSVAGGTPVDVGTANADGAATTFARSNHVHKAFGPTVNNKGMAGIVTAADAQKATNTTVAATPALNSYVGVRINGFHVQVGDTGTFATAECYFGQGDTTTGRAIADIQAGDTLRWNGTVALYEISATDIIDFDYIA